jgi:hypothetical protein
MESSNGIIPSGRWGATVRREVAQWGLSHDWMIQPYILSEQRRKEVIQKLKVTRLDAGDSEPYFDHVFGRWISEPKSHRDMSQHCKPRAGDLYYYHKP